MRRLITILATSALAMVALALPVAADSHTASVRVVHASPDAPNIDVWVDGEVALTDVPFTAVSDYLSLPAAAHQVQVTATGSPDPVIDATLTLEPGTSYTVVATGLLADIEATVLVDDRAPADRGKLRFVHAAPAAPDSVDIGVADGPTLVEGLGFREASTYLEVDPGAYAVEIRAAGETDAALTADASLEAGQVYTAFAMDGPGNGVQVVIAVDTEAIPDTAMPAATGSAALALAGVALLTVGMILVARRRLAGVAV